MQSILDAINEWIKEILIGAINGNLSTMFGDVNEKVGTIAAEVGQTPQGWNANIFSMIQTLSENVIVPIAGLVITYVLCYELISMVTEKNNMHDVDTSMFFKWVFKAFVAVYLVTHTFDITMAVFDMAQHVVSGAAGVIGGSTEIDVAAALASMQDGLDAMEIPELLLLAIEADSLGAAKSRLARIETDVLNNFKLLGVSARPMTGYERLKMLHGIFHPEGGQFAFDFSWLAPSGLSTKDFIAPSSFRFGEGRYFRMGRKIGAVSFLEILAPELNDRILSDILDLETGVIVNLHIHSIDQTEAIKTIKRKITDLDKMKIEEQKKAVRSGYDMDIIPSDLATFGSEAKNLLQDLQSRNERMFLLTFLVVNMADTKRKLENDVFAAAGIAQKNNCALTRLDYQQEAGLMSSVPLGENLIPIQRGLTTSSTAIFIPFITQELFQTGAALYYGLNALSNNMILCDRKQLKNPNGLILGTPGSGKSFAAKREMTNAFLITDDDIIICDPEAEYFSLVQRLDGQVIRLSPTGKGIDGKPQYVNPMDINLNYSEDDSPLALKSDFILSLCELVIGGKEGFLKYDQSLTTGSQYCDCFIVMLS